MARLAIVPPVPVMAATGSFAGAVRLLTPDPREAAVLTGGGAGFVDIDFGVVRTIDAIFVGHTSAEPGRTLTAAIGIGAPRQADVAVLAAAPSRQSRRPVAARHFLHMLDAPVEARFLSISGSGLPAGFTIGTVAAGLSFRPTWSQEWGSGRSVGDTGTRERLRSGGFGIDDGVSYTGWSWTLGDLSDDEVDELYAIARDRRQSRSVLVVEDYEQSAGLNERAHWGMFDRIEPYERRDTAKTRWAFRIDDWA